MNRTPLKREVFVQNGRVYIYDHANKLYDSVNAQNLVDIVEGYISLGADSDIEDWGSGIANGDGAIDSSGTYLRDRIITQSVRIDGNKTLPLQQQPLYLIGTATILNTSGQSEGILVSSSFNSDKTISVGNSDYDGCYLFVQYKY